jgi:hypothetical protein
MPSAASASRIESAFYDQFRHQNETERDKERYQEQSADEAGIVLACHAAAYYRTRRHSNVKRA